MKPSPMDRLLLDTITRIEADWSAREARLLHEIGALRQQIAARDRTMARLTASLNALLDPSAPPRS